MRGCAASPRQLRRGHEVAHIGLVIAVAENDEALAGNSAFRRATIAL